MFEKSYLQPSPQDKGDLHSNRWTQCNHHEPSCGVHSSWEDRDIFAVSPLPFHHLSWKPPGILVGLINGTVASVSVLPLGKYCRLAAVAVSILYLNITDKIWFYSLLGSDLSISWKPALLFAVLWTLSRHSEVTRLSWTNILVDVGLGATPWF